MSSSGKIILSIVIIGMICLATGRMESHSRYHIDTLRQERFTTIRVAGISIVRRQSMYDDPYEGAYTAITGKEAGSDRWLGQRPDFEVSWRGSIESCFNSAFPVPERRKLIEKLFQLWRNGMPKEIAADYFQRIDLLLPFHGPKPAVDFSEQLLADIAALETRLEREQYRYPGGASP